VIYIDSIISKEPVSLNTLNTEHLEGQDDWRTIKSV
jgi:hypothetical protein